MKLTDTLRKIACRIYLSATIKTWQNLETALEQLLMKADNRELPTDNFFKAIITPDNVKFIKEAVDVITTLRHLSGYLVQKDIDTIKKTDNLSQIKTALHHWLQTINSLSEA